MERQEQITANIKCTESDIKTLMNMKRVVTKVSLKIRIYSKRGANLLGIVDVKTIDEGSQGGICKVNTPIIPMDNLTLTYHKEIYNGEDGVVIYPPYFRIYSYEENGEVKC